MDRPRERFWLWAAWALLALSCLKDVYNPDVFWHLSAGRRILALGAIPRADWLSFTRPGAPWIDFEWLTELVYALLYNAAGWWGLIAWKTALALSAALVVERALARAGAGPAARACALAALTAGWAPLNDVRPDNLSLALLCGELALLERCRAGRGPRPAVLAAGAAAVFSLWADAHAGFALGLCAAACYALLGEKRTRARALALLCGGALGTLLTPFGVSLYGVLAAHLREGATMSRYILEWRWPDPRVPAFAGYWLLLGFSAWALGRLGLRRGEAAPWAALAGLALLGALHRRDIPYFAAAAALLPGLMLLSRGRLAAPRWAAPAALAAAAAIASFTPQKVSRSGLDDAGMPVGAADYLAAHPEVSRLRLYNLWEWGGYLGFRLGPDHRVFLDGRYLFHDMIPALAAADRDQRSWNAFLDAEKIDGALVRRGHPDYDVTWTDAAGRERRATLPWEVLFMPPARWKLAYQDERSTLFLRR